MSQREDRTSLASSGNLAELRLELARTREEARQEIAELRRQLAAASAREPVRDSRVATEQLALEQEVNALRRALIEKDRTLDGISQECRKLEDAVEDEHQAADTLRQDLQRMEAVLATTQEAIAALERERDALRLRLLGRRPDTDRGNALKAGRRSPSSKVPMILAGTGMLLLLVAIAMVVGYLGLEPFLAGLSSTRADRSAQVGDTTNSPSRGNAGADTGPRQGADAGAQFTESRVLPTLRDPLPDGTAGPEMVVLPAGDFVMGSRGVSGERDEHPDRQVSIAAFLIGANEVTFADYDRFARATGRHFPADFGWGRDRRPVVDVTWDDAQAYALWLSQQTGERYRLPSEAEWEYAARGGTRSFYWWGSSPEPGRAVCFDCGTDWDGRSTAPTGRFEPNPFGLYDTAGNVLEWTADCYRRNYQGAPSNGTAWDEDECLARVARGGAFNKPAHSMRSAARAHFAPDTHINMIGFRLARDE